MASTTQSRAALLFGLVALMWLVWLLDAVTPGSGSAAGHGIVPRTSYGLEGIPIAPLIHANFDHLLSNTVPFLILGAIIAMRGTTELAFVTLVTMLVAGCGTWLFGAGGAQHIGASGVIFGFFGYLLFRTFFDRRWSSVFVAIAVAVLYGASMAYSLVPAQGISWSGHLFGFIGGFIAARIRYGRRAYNRAFETRSTR